MKRKIVRYHVAPYQGAAAFATQMWIKGWRVVGLERRGTIAKVIYEKEQSVDDEKARGDPTEAT